MNKSIAVIPARGGSKRIPRKNIKLFHDKPLISYSIETALKSKLFDTVIVSTDDTEIAKISEQYGAEVPFIRPKDISDDHSGTQAVVSHAIKAVEKLEQTKYDYACTIYATAPMMQINYLVKGFEALLNNDITYAFSATSFSFPIQRAFFINPENRCEMFEPENFQKRSQDLKEAYHDAGQFYWQNLNNPVNDILFSHQSMPILIPRYLVQDIDTLEDWVQAEHLYNALNS